MNIECELAPPASESWRSPLFMHHYIEAQVIVALVERVSCLAIEATVEVEIAAQNLNAANEKLHGLLVVLGLDDPV